MINQLQALFLLLLVRSFIPGDVKAAITGPDFALNIYSYAPFSTVEWYSSLFSGFEFAVTNSRFDDFAISSDSSVYNSYPMLT